MDFKKSNSGLLWVGLLFLFCQQSVLAQSKEYHTVRSANGTKIGYTKTGSGSVPVVFVHGALNTGEQWLLVAETLSEHCTCYVMDRWGRGGSSYRENYSFEREAEDNSGTFQFQSRHASSSLSKFLAF